MSYPRVQSQTVLVTGCSSGIGAATAQVLRAAGWAVWPTARKTEDLDRLRADGFSPIELDLGDSASVRGAAEQVLRESDGQLGALVNNAGFGQPGAVEDLSRSTLKEQFEINVFGLQELTNALLPTFRDQGWGRIVHISSVLGRVAIPMVGAYCASKFAVEALGDAMRVELRGTGIAVVLVEPGPIVSAFRRTAAAQAEAQLDVSASRFGADYAKEIERRAKQRKKPDFFTKPPEAVARKVLHALTSARPRARYCVTIPAYLGALARRCVPTSLLDHLLARRLP